MQTHSLKDPVMRKPTENIVGGGGAGGGGGIINFKIRGFFPFFSSFQAGGGARITPLLNFLLSSSPLLDCED